MHRNRSDWTFMSVDNRSCGRFIDIPDTDIAVSRASDDDAFINKANTIDLFSVTFENSNNLFFLAIINDSIIIQSTGEKSFRILLTNLQCNDAGFTDTMETCL